MNRHYHSYNHRKPIREGMIKGKTKPVYNSNDDDIINLMYDDFNVDDYEDDEYGDAEDSMYADMSYYADLFLDEEDENIEGLIDKISRNGCVYAEAKDFLLDLNGGAGNYFEDGADYGYTDDWDTFISTGKLNTWILVLQFDDGSLIILDNSAPRPSGDVFAIRILTDEGVQAHNKGVDAKTLYTSDRYSETPNMNLRGVRELFNDWWEEEKPTTQTNESYRRYKIGDELDMMRIHESRYPRRYGRPLRENRNPRYTYRRRVR